VNKIGQIFSELVNRELGDSCSKCGSSNVCILPIDDKINPFDGTLESYEKFWERYITNPVLIKEELHLGCDCSKVFASSD